MSKLIKIPHTNFDDLVIKKNIYTNTIQTFFYSCKKSEGTSKLKKSLLFPQEKQKSQNSLFPFFFFPIYKLSVKQFGSQMRPHILWGASSEIQIVFKG